MHIERMDEYHMARRVLVADVSGGRVIDRPSLSPATKVRLDANGWMVHRWPLAAEG